MNPNHKINTKKGFTLIEIMVALAIMSVSLVVILQLFSGGLRSIKISDDYLRATILARNKMNEFEAKYSILRKDQGVFKNDMRYNWVLSVESYDLADLHPHFENLKFAEGENEKTFSVDKITLKVFWKTDHGQRKMELVTLKTLTTVNPASKMTLLGYYQPGYRIPRGLQFGNQDVPEGQSEKDFVTVDVSGRKMILERQPICGSSTDIPIAICGN